ncbi:MAG TPA: hypothetical protein VGJ01_17990 [Pseudolabrys sp.]|jgi:hypothetical protein
MLGRLCLAGALPLLLIASPVLSPVLAATNAQKMETCKFGADNDKLAGAKRDAFIKRCMAGGNYEPAARKDAMKKGGAKKPAAAAQPPADPASDEAPAEEN